MVDIAPNPACPWCHADDTNLHMLTCVPDGRGFVHQQQSTLFDSLSSKNPRSRQGLHRLMDQRLFVLGRPVPAIVQVEVRVHVNPAALLSVLNGTLTPSLVRCTCCSVRESIQARRLRHRPIAGEFRGAPP